MPPEGAGEWRLHKKKLYKQYSHILKISYFREMCTMAARIMINRPDQKYDYFQFVSTWHAQNIAL